MIIKLQEKNIGDWIIYSDGFKNERGKIKSFDNSMKAAWVVYNANNNWDGNHWKDYTAACTNYRDLSFDGDKEPDYDIHIQGSRTEK